MRKTHKNILGFAGLGLVAAVTTVAAALPSPGVSAVSSVTDTIQVRVIPAESDISISSSFGPEVHSPDYNFDVLYSGITDIKVELVNKDGAGNIIFGPVELWHIDADWDPGSKNFPLNLDDYGGYGYFTFTAIGLGHEGVPVEKILTVRYKKPGGEEIDGGEVDVDEETGTGNVDTHIEKEIVVQADINIYDEDGNLVRGPIHISHPGSLETIDVSGLPAGTYTAEIITEDEDRNVLDIKYVTIIIDGTTDTATVPIEQEVDTITKFEADIYDEEGNLKRVVIADRETGEVSVYDADGNLIYTVPNGYSEEGGFDIPFNGLPYGDYTVKVYGKNKYDKLVGNIYVYTMHWYGKGVPVPDTGGLFQKLNISREDYLITGLIVFMVIGIVAFGVVARSRKTKTSKKNRR